MPKKVVDPRKLVEYLQILGPRNISAIAREVGHHPETVRYWVGKLNNMGFRCVPVINYAKFGLRPVISILRLSKVLHGHEMSFGKLLAEVAYCSFFARTLFDKSLIAYFYLPADKTSAFLEFMNKLKEMELVEAYKAYVTSARVPLPFRPEFFDFQHRTWSINWKELDSVGQPILAEDLQPSLFDALDVKMVRAIQKNPAEEFMGLAAEIDKKLTLKTVLYHYKAHLVGRRLLSGYNVLWTGEPAITPAHRVLYPKIWLENLTYSEYVSALGALTSLPFSWAIFYNDDRTFLYSEAVIPQYQFIEAATWLSERLPPEVAAKLRIAFIDRNTATAYLFPSHMFDASSGRWLFDSDIAVRAVQLLQKEITAR